MSGDSFKRASRGTTYVASWYSTMRQSSDNASSRAWLMIDARASQFDTLVLVLFPILEADNDVCPSTYILGAAACE